MLNFFFPFLRYLFFFFTSQTLHLNCKRARPLEPSSRRVCQLPPIFRYAYRFPTISQSCLAGMARSPEQAQSIFRFHKFLVLFTPTQVLLLPPQPLNFPSMLFLVSQGKTRLNCFLGDRYKCFELTKLCKLYLHFLKYPCEIYRLSYS